MSSDFFKGYFNDKVRIGGATSGEIIGLDRPRTVTVDISDLIPGTEATLCFDLLGFGDADSRVVIDSVRLSYRVWSKVVGNWEQREKVGLAKERLRSAQWLRQKLIYWVASHQ